LTAASSTDIGSGKRFVLASLKDSKKNAPEGVVKTEPDWNRVPKRVHRLLKKSLETDPQQRLRDIGDFELLVGEEAELPEGLSKMPWIAATLALTLALASVIGIALWRSRSTERALQPLIQFQVDLGLDVSAQTRAPIFSSDGTRIVYVSRGRIMTRRLPNATGPVTRPRVPYPIAQSLISPVGDVT
jgi:hypothetical protein